MDAGFFDVFHDAGDEDVGAVTQAVDIDLDGIAQVAVEQQWIGAEQGVDLSGLVVRIARLDLLGHQFRYGPQQIVGEVALLANDLHGAAAQHIGRANNQGEADLGGDETGLLNRVGDAVLRLPQIEFAKQFLEAVAIFRKVDGVRIGAQNWNAGALQRVGQFERRLPTELHDHPVQRAGLLFGANDFDNVFGR